MNETMEVKAPVNGNGQSLPANIKPAITEKCVVLCLELNKPGNRKKVSSSKAAEGSGADANMLSVSKKLLESDAFQAIEKKYGQIGRHCRSLALTSIFKDGMYPIPLGKWEALDEYLEAQVVALQPLIEDFIVNHYVKDRDASLAMLGELADPTDYPDPEQMKQAFGMVWYWVEINSANIIGVTNPEAAKKNKAKMAQAFQQAEMNIQEAQAVLFQGLLDHLIERLTPDPTGKKKVLQNRVLDNLREFMDDFKKSGNVADNAKLGAIVDECKAVLNGTSAADIKSYPTLKSKLQDTLASARSKVDQLLVDKPKRKFSFGQAEVKAEDGGNG